MKILTATLSATALTATAAVAGMSVETFDRDGDRFVSYAELVAVLPKATRADFHDLDVNRDQRLSANEVVAPGAEVILARGADGLVGTGGISDIDTDGDNFASYAEVVAAHPGFQLADFDDIDVNDDRRISRTELYRGTAQEIFHRYEEGSRILVSLSEIDLDGSGFASMSELAASYPGLSTPDFHDIDLNRDNRISFDELYSIDSIAVLGRRR